MLFFISAVCQTSYAQMNVLESYPKGQDFYEGGLAGFYKDAHEYLTGNNKKECAEKEIYQPRIIVTDMGGVKLIQDSDTLNIAKNKCAYDLSLEVLKNLKGWKPAQVKGNTLGAITEFIFYPKDLMSNYKTGYNADDFVLHSQYPGGLKTFNKDFHDNFQALFADYHINGEVNLEFYINEEGHITKPRIYPSIDNKSFNIDFMRTLSRLKKVWKPALYSNIPIKEKFAFPVKFSITFNER